MATYPINEQPVQLPGAPVPPEVVVHAVPVTRQTLFDPVTLIPEVGTDASPD